MGIVYCFRDWSICMTVKLCPMATFAPATVLSIHAGFCRLLTLVSMSSKVCWRIFKKHLCIYPARIVEIKTHVHKTSFFSSCAVMSTLCKGGGNQFMSWWDTSLILYHKLSKLTVPFLWNFTTSMLSLIDTHLEWELELLYRVIHKSLPDFRT